MIRLFYSCLILICDDKHKNKVLSDDPNITVHPCQAKKPQNRINPAATIVAQSTLFQVQNHKNKVIFQ